VPNTINTHLAASCIQAASRGVHCIGGTPQVADTAFELVTWPSAEPGMPGVGNPWKGDGWLTHWQWGVSIDWTEGCIILTF